MAMTKHNLTASGTGAIHVAGQGDMCKFCHTPHASNPIGPLWNRLDKGVYYKTYDSPTLVAHVGQPTGSSRLCLSCHDGTIALTQTYNSRNAPQGSVFISAGDKGYIGTDLSVHHPISFVYDDTLAGKKGQMRSPESLPRELRLDKDRQLQCTTCHDPHDNKFGKFLAMDNTESRMCQSCHAPDLWSLSAHATSAASLAPSREKWDNIQATTVREAACEACHRPHSAGGRQWLLRHEAGADNCLCCHDGSVATTNIQAQLAKASVHPMWTSTAGQSPKGSSGWAGKHVSCQDCHNPHQALKGARAQAPFVQPVMRGVSGATGAGATVARATYEYQVCYKCHAGGGAINTTMVVNRAIANFDLGDQFCVNNPSFHPIEAVGKNMNVPSLIPPMTISARIYCTDCHGSDSSSTPGPHGSRNRPLLVSRYDTADNMPESPLAYALCYNCHLRTSILANQSFPKHHLHLTNVKAPCSACHDSHGLSARQVMGTQGAHLINFDSRIAFASKTTKTGPLYASKGMMHGSCTLFCHGKDHVNLSY
jgi:predicted CXXCH cytochrome family protein